MTSRDPYNIGHGLKTDAEIAELRRRKRGKRLAKYHRRQNDVRVASSFSDASMSRSSLGLMDSSSLLS
jgi:hypothetical protein